MAKRGVPPTPQPPQLTPRQIQAAIARLQNLIRDLEGFDPQSVQARTDPRIKVLEVSIDEALNAL